jgi:hypothetical protein
MINLSIIMLRQFCGQMQGGFAEQMMAPGVQFRRGMNNIRPGI